MAARILTLTLTIATLFSGAAYAGEKIGILIYADRLHGRNYTVAELREHEMGHINCPKWRHPIGYEPGGKLSRPPVECRGKPKIRIEEARVSLTEAWARCSAMLGTTDRVDGCSVIVIE